MYNYHSYLMAEEFHPLVFEMELENPEDLPDEIDGEKVSYYDNEYVYGSNLLIRSDEDRSVKFINPNEDDVRYWLESVKWFGENIISEIEDIIKM